MIVKTTVQRLFYFLSLLLIASLVVPGDTIAASRPLAFVPTGTGVIKVSAGVEAATAGQVALASEVTGTLPIANGGTGSTTGSWATIFDIDFSVESNQTLGSDGTYTIGGITWTKVNTAKETTPFAVVTGTGLTNVTANTGTNCFSGGQACPAIYTDGIATLIPDFEPMWPIRITFWDQSSVAGLNNDPRVRYGVLFNTTGFNGATGTPDGIEVSRGMQGSTQCIRFDVYQTFGNLGGPQVNFTINSTNEITELFVPWAWWHAAALVSYSSGSAPNFLDRKTRVPLLQKQDGSNFNPPIGNSVGISGMRFFIAVSRNSTNPFTSVIKRMKVEYSRF